MDIIRDLKVGTKIVAGFTVVLALMALIGAVAILRFGQINATVSNLADDLAAEQRLSDEIVSQIWTARFFAQKYVNQQLSEDLERFNQELADFDQLLTRADAHISDSQRVQTLSSIQAGIQEFGNAFYQVVNLIDERNTISQGTLDVQGSLADLKLDQLRDSIFETEDAVASHYAGDVQGAYLRIRLNTFRYLATGDEQWVSERRYQEVRAAFQLLQEHLQDPAQLALAEEAEAAVETYISGLTLIQADYAQQNQIVAGELNTIGPEIETSGAEMSASVGADFQAANQSTRTLVNQTRVLLLVTMTLAIFVGLGFGLFLSRNISHPIKTVTQAAALLAQGDVNQSLTISSGDEIGEMANAFRHMIAYQQEMADAADHLAQGDTAVDVTPQSEQDRLGQAFRRMIDYQQEMAAVAQVIAGGDLTANVQPRGIDDLLGNAMSTMIDGLRDVTGQIKAAAQSLNSAAAEILAATTQQTAGASEQSASIAQTTTTVDEVKVIAEQAVERAQEVADASQHTVEISHDGQQAVQNTIASMGRIKERVEGIAENILALSEQTQQIGDIITSVNDLAAQSNMLALNAAVEAARAGEHGKGFAVVAAEVRSLAEQSKQATAQVKTILEDIQKATNSTVMATEEGTKGVDEGVSLAAQAQDAIAQLAGVIDGSAQAATQMVAGGRQQASGVEQIALAMQNIHQATNQSLASTHQAEKTAQDLSELARSLSEIVEQYQL